MANVKLLSSWTGSLENLMSAERLKGLVPVRVGICSPKLAGGYWLDGSMCECSSADEVWCDFRKDIWPMTGPNYLGRRTNQQQLRWLSLSYITLCDVFDTVVHNVVADTVTSVSTSLSRRQRRWSPLSLQVNVKLREP